MCPTPPEPKGWGGHNLDDWRKRQVVCLLCALLLLSTLMLLPLKSLQYLLLLASLLLLALQLLLLSLLFVVFSTCSYYETYHYRTDKFFAKGPSDYRKSDGRTEKRPLISTVKSWLCLKKYNRIAFVSIYLQARHRTNRLTSGSACIRWKFHLKGLSRKKYVGI